MHFLFVARSDDEGTRQLDEGGMRSSSHFEAERLRQLMQFADQASANKLEVRPTLGTPQRCTLTCFVCSLWAATRRVLCGGLEWRGRSPHA